MFRYPEKPTLSLEALWEEAALFAAKESTYDEPSLFGVTDGKAVGTYLEHKFTNFLLEKYQFNQGNSASGIDFPELEIDMKVTSVKQPQSSCPYKSARQKIFGLGYHLIVFVYEKFDDAEVRTGRLDMRHTIFVHRDRTGDHQMTRGLCEILDRDGNEEDLIAFMVDRNLPIDDIEAQRIAEELMQKRPEIGYLTISNALQWRFQYKRVIDCAGVVDGVRRIR
jgi:hypothetical protein